MPKGQEKKYKRCVKKVAARGGAQNPHAVCMASLTKKKKKKKKKQ